MIGFYMDSALDGVLRIGQEQLSQVESFLKRQDSDAPVEVLKGDKLSFLKINDKVWFGFIQPKAQLPMDQLKNIPKDLNEGEIFEVEPSALKAAIGALKATAEDQDSKLKLM